jgi:hypothetical protein
LKCKSYHCFKLVYNSGVLNYETAIFFLTSSSSSPHLLPHLHGKERRGRGGGLRRGGWDGPAGRGRGRGHRRRGGARGSTVVAAGHRHRHRRRRGGGRGATRRGNGGGGAPPPGKVRESEGGPTRTGKRRIRTNPRYNNGGFPQGKKTLAGAEDKSIDCRRFGGPIDEPDVPRRSPRQDERSGILGLHKRCTD